MTGLAAPAIAAGMAALGAAVPVLGASGLTAAAAVAGSAMGSVAVAASFGGKTFWHSFYVLHPLRQCVLFTQLHISCTNDWR
jgi:hypothetical protein